MSYYEIQRIGAGIMAYAAQIEAYRRQLAIHKLMEGLSFAKAYIAPYLEYRIGSRLVTPVHVWAANLPEWSAPWGYSAKYRKTVARITSKRVLIGDLSVAEMSQELINYWLVPHELLHSVYSDERLIENTLIRMNEEFGRFDIAYFIRNSSGYLTPF